MIQHKQFNWKIFPTNEVIFFTKTHSAVSIKVEVDFSIPRYVTSHTF